mmetsp:Transcript_2079/g.2851  ORF Transcript_2079/g.2851 Transcript_2079/m.2851 type:complete len:107 (+) Transcript_2079:463-783(+)
MISAFDEAIMSPFIQESSTKKKWSCRGNSFTSDTTATTATMLEEEDFAPTDEEAANDQAPLILANQHDTIMFVQEDDIELAVLQERKEDIVEINQSMKQINSIQKR